MAERQGTARCEAGFERKSIHSGGQDDFCGGESLGLGSSRLQALSAPPKKCQLPHPSFRYPITHPTSVVYKTIHLEDTRAQLTWLLWHVLLLHTITHSGISFTSLQPLNDGFQTAWLFNISEWWHIEGILFWSWDQTHPFVVIEKYWRCLLGVIKTSLSWQNRGLSFVRPLGASQGLGWLKAALKSHLQRAFLVLLAGQAHVLRTWFPGSRKRGSSSFSPVVSALPEETLEDNTGPRVNAACTQLEKCSAK